MFGKSLTHRCNGSSVPSSTQWSPSGEPVLKEQVGNGSQCFKIVFGNLMQTWVMFSGGSMGMFLQIPIWKKIERL